MLKPLPMRKVNSEVMLVVADAPDPRPVVADSPALAVMTDLKRVLAATVSPTTLVTQATAIMIARRVRLLFVIDATGRVIGLLSARDTMGEKPIQLLQQRRAARFDQLTVNDLMVPAVAIDVLDFAQVLGATVGEIVATLKQSGRQHALVVEHDDLRQGDVVRGIFSATQIARQLGVSLPVEEVAQTFADLTAALEK